MAMGSGALDRLSLPGGTLLDLDGNASEWGRDYFQAWTEPCWADVRVYHDPECTTRSPSLGAAHSARAGSWLSVPVQLAASSRAAVPEALLITPQEGFRCARPATQ
jgi:hypothetical protein